MEPNIFFGKFLIGFQSVYLLKRTCQDCAPFIKNGSEILDLGCGRGKITSAIKKYFDCRVVGVDIQDVRTIRDFPFYLIDGEHLPFDDNFFDVVFIRYVLHHCPTPFPLLTEAKRVSKEKIIIYEDLPENFFSKFLCKLHGLSFNFFLQPKFTKCSFNDSSGWEQIFDKLGLRVIHKKAFFSFRVDPRYPIQRIFFVLKKDQAGV